MAGEEESVEGNCSVKHLDLQKLANRSKTMRISSTSHTADRPNYCGLDRLLEEPAKMLAVVADGRWRMTGDSTFDS